MESYVIVRLVHKNEIRMVCQAIRDAYFLPKRSWNKPLHEMAYSGLLSQKWTGIGLFTKANEILAYLDYKQVGQTFIEIGICLTIEKFRNRGYMHTLFQFLFDTYPEYSFRIGTYENNDAMIHCIKSFGFQEERRVTNDRIDGTSTIYYIRKEVATNETGHYYALHGDIRLGQSYSAME